jgi:hypothetical protein
MYTLQALNHWLYKMVEEPVTLMPFLELTYCPPGTSHLSRHNRASIMEAAPNGCKAIMIHYQHEYEKDGAIQKVATTKRGCNRQARGTSAKASPTEPGSGCALLLNMTGKTSTLNTKMTTQ